MLLIQTEQAITVPAPPTIGLQQDPAPPAPPSTVGILPRILLPDGTSFAIPGGHALHGGQGVGNNAGAREFDAFQTSDIPATPTIELRKWKGRLEEIQNFGQYVEQLVIWVGSVSDSFVIEIAYAVIADHEIRPEILLLNRSVVDWDCWTFCAKRLIAFQRQPSSRLPTLQGSLAVFSEWIRSTSSTQPWVLRDSEHALKQWTSDHKRWVNLAIARFPQLLNVWIPSIMIRRYAKLIGSLGPTVDPTALDILPVDSAMILLRPAVLQYVVMHSISESYADIRFAALRYESAQRVWKEVSPKPQGS